MRFYLLSLLLLTFFGCLAQNDTTYTYLDSSESVCSKDTAVFVKLFYKQDGIWYLEKYSNKTKYILQETTFSEQDEDIHSILSYKEFVDSGTLYKRIEFVRGIKKNGFYYYPNGAIRGTATFNTQGDIVAQTGYDENGGATKFYCFEKPPALIGDASMWSKHVYQKLNTTRLFRNKAPNGNYRLQLLFYVAIDGTVSNVTVDKDPGYGIKEEAIRLLKTAGKWNAGIINGKKVQLPARLTFAFKLDRQIADN
jgi:Gram-negative bacterial TonB protein C-terminal